MGIRCIVGLGNPGPRYEWTRHNLGFLVLDRFIADRNWSWRRERDGEESEGRIGGEEIVLLKPMRYMNRSGGPVRDLLARCGRGPEELLVLVDDAALPVGRIRIRKSGGAGGHRGLESIEEELESRAYRRLRIGVGEAPEGMDLADHLLRELEEAERERFEAVARSVAGLLPDLIRRGVDWAMNRYNAEGAPSAPKEDEDRTREGEGST
ncbi:MAG: aminoacyl-tRNA hydrolase [Candidatus Eisenbacteria bacterium]|nr:aminoacyl-tRNA hydrolase [Candidatus Latescibacterota bacterium]MBD3301087.1 aminoacyl-tRNA hydrolase [Candidatus Eisenbacteria bacterium]